MSDQFDINAAITNASAQLVMNRLIYAAHAAAVCARVAYNATQLPVHDIPPVSDEVVCQIVGAAFHSAFEEYLHGDADEAK